ncbi:MAG: class I SAM-dependent methyltransferase [Deltaproteobacteria bacterium]|nr:class I SAM-dependent methyltransferase [Deltaproteobacteria bacterium]
MDGDRERWNATWRERAGELERPARFLEEHAHLLPASGKALDLAGGAGRNAIWLARRGLDVTLVDVSDVALTRAESRAASTGVTLRTRRVDLDEPLELAPLYDLVVIVHFLDRDHRDDYAQLLVEGGVLVHVQQTVVNLERHAKPSRRFLVEQGELAEWIARIGFELVAEREGWNDDGVHEAAVIARRIAVAAQEPEPEPPAPSGGPYR